MLNFGAMMSITISKIKETFPKVCDHRMSQDQKADKKEQKLGKITER